MLKCVDRCVVFFLRCFQAAIRISPYNIAKVKRQFLWYASSVCVCVYSVGACVCAGCCIGMCWMPQFYFSLCCVVSLSCDINQSQSVCMRTKSLRPYWCVCVYTYTHTEKWTRVWRTDVLKAHTSHLRIYEQANTNRETKKETRERECRREEKKNAFLSQQFEILPIISCTWIIKPFGLVS